MKTYEVSEDRIREGITMEGASKTRLSFFVPQRIGGDVRLTVDKALLRDGRLAERVSLILEEIPNREYSAFRAVAERSAPEEHSRALTLINLGPECTYNFDFQKALVRCLAEDRKETRALLVLSPGAEIKINRPSSRYNGKTQFVVTWNGAVLKSEDRDSELLYI